MNDVIIVGGGIAGLATAHELHRRGVPFVLFERGSRAGGVILSEQVDGYTIDAGPDSLLVQKPDGIRLCEELNTAFQEECYFSTAMVTRALLDHVPPVFGFKAFNEVANSYAGGGKSFKEAMQRKAQTRVTGYGLEDGVQMGPVISPDSRVRIVALIDRAIHEGARPLVDGRNATIARHRGNFVKPTLLEGLAFASEITRTEIFGPVLSIHHVDDIDAVVQLQAADYLDSDQRIRATRNEVLVCAQV